jgi:hypothetical protein
MGLATILQIFTQKMTILSYSRNILAENQSWK